MDTTIDLQQQYAALKSEQPKLRIRNAANLLGVSELELLELNLGKNVKRLSGGWKALLKEIHKMGKVMALTRNDYAVHERKGVYHNVSFMENHNMGVAVNEDIDLRFFMWNWKYAYAVTMEVRNRTLYSIQFFDGYGEAVHKIYSTQKSNIEAYHEIVEKYKAEDQTSTVKIEDRIPPSKTMTPDSEIEVKTFQQEWLDLKDTHDFFGLINKHKLQRTQALRLAPKDHAHKVNNQFAEKMFEACSSQEVPIMVFVGNRGCIQIHSGKVNKLVPMEGWFNIMDPDFNLHLSLKGVYETWVVKKPTADGIVTSVEVFDVDGKVIVQCFGKRKPGIPELTEWQNVIASLM
ncbi:MAG: ChuX/HutX family heme-like substrate-binding protein [Bacteroidota bacterium]